MIHVTWLGVVTCFRNWRQSLGLFTDHGEPVQVKQTGVWFCGEKIVVAEKMHGFFGVSEAMELSKRLDNVKAVEDKDFVRFEKWPTCARCGMKLEAIITGLYG